MPRPYTSQNPWREYNFDGTIYRILRLSLQYAESSK